MNESNSQLGWKRFIRRVILLNLFVIILPASFITWKALNPSPADIGLGLIMFLIWPCLIFGGVAVLVTNIKQSLKILKTRATSTGQRIVCRAIIVLSSLVLLACAYSVVLALMATGNNSSSY